MTMCLEKSIHLVVQHGILEAHFLYCSSSVVYKSFPLPVHNLSFPNQMEISPQSNSLGMRLRQRTMWWEQRKLMKYELRVRWENNDHEYGLSASQRTEMLGDLGAHLVLTPRGRCTEMARGRRLRLCSSHVPSHHLPSRQGSLYPSPPWLSEDKLLFQTLTNNINI